MKSFQLKQRMGVMDILSEFYPKYKEDGLEKVQYMRERKPPLPKEERIKKFVESELLRCKTIAEQTALLEVLANPVIIL